MHRWKSEVEKLFHANGNKKSNTHIRQNRPENKVYNERKNKIFSSVQSPSHVHSTWPHELQHTRPPDPSPTLGVHSNLCRSSRWCHPAISSSVVPFSSCPQSLPLGFFSNKSTLRMRWPKYWSFSFRISPSDEYSGLISFRMDWLDVLAVQGTL